MMMWSTWVLLFSVSKAAERMRRRVGDGDFGLGHAVGLDEFGQGRRVGRELRDRDRDFGNG